MTRLLHIAAMTLVAFTLTSSFAAADSYPPFIAHYDPPAPQASAGGNGGQSNGSGGNGGNSSAPEPARVIKLACIVGGSPAEFPNDIWVTNTSHATLLAGTKFSFSIPAVGVKGAFLLPSNVPAGKQVKIADLFGGAESGSPCTVKLVG